MKPVHKIEDIHFDGNYMFIKIDGREYSFDLYKISPRLLKANKMQRTNYRISPSGYWIHWPYIDEDLSIDGLLGIKHKPISRKKVKTS